MFTDLGFSFTAVDGGKKCTETKDLEVTIEVLSNEVVATGAEVSYITLQAWIFVCRECCFLYYTFIIRW